MSKFKFLGRTKNKSSIRDTLSEYSLAYSRFHSRSILSQVWFLSSPVLQDSCCLPLRPCKLLASAVCFGKEFHSGHLSAAWRNAFFCFKLGSHQLQSVVPSSYFGSDNEQLMLVHAAQDWSSLQITFFSENWGVLICWVFWGRSFFPFSDPCSPSVNLFQFFLFLRYCAAPIILNLPS